MAHGAGQHGGAWERAGSGAGSQHTPQAPSVPKNCCAKFGSAGLVSERV